MSQRCSVQEPSALSEAITELWRTTRSDKSLTLQIYARINDRILPADPVQSDWFDVSVIVSLLNDWILAMRALQTPSSEHTSDVGFTPKLTIIFDLTRRLPQETDRTVLFTSEARGLTRMSAILRKLLRGKADLRATVLGVSCWCLHEEQASNVVLPLVDSWPLQRAAHEYDPEGRVPKHPSKCMRLAEEHWDDDHWKLSSK